ncbi:hypothetical protein CC80DRAFT_487901 [Byssothecium circinans]|uniref:Uncharacterized protein n=1 Tax=Byssothecium circinans TaxID=147558 RepID=A0A6A5UDQ2_9PLEO|nr:hypothetical protein CC80DRAFT_487901 [Byssothecium circinans]
MMSVDDIAALEHAGRQPAHPFRDMRSAVHAKNRTRKHHHRYKNFQTIHPIDLPSHPHQRPYVRALHGEDQALGEDPCSFPADLSTLPPQKFAKREAYVMAQQEAPPFPKNHSHRKRHLRKWRKSCVDRHETHREVRECDWQDRLWGDVFEYCCSHCCGVAIWMQGEGDEERAEIARAVYSWDEPEVGEAFEKWGQRRINEMRMVKEERLRAKLAAENAARDVAPSAPTADLGREEDEDEGYHSFTSSSTTTTTLATTTEDIEAEALVEYMLYHYTWMKYPEITGFRWFNDRNIFWYWHRNMTGCWELSEWNCKGEDGSVCKGCETYKGMGRWDPEARSQAWWLEAWISGEDWEEMERRDREWEWEKREREEDEEWDRISTSSATSSWSEVDVSDTQD